jgi:(p)ppGpp synthase/HD superfamily hydrolase
MSDLGRAIAIAASAHQDQLDKNGTPYILHPIRMMLKMDNVEQMIATVLHDVIEDTEWTLDHLRKEGFSDRIVDLVDLLSRRELETYDEFIERLRTDPVAVKVKLADLEDNMDITRLPEITEKDISRLKRSHHHWLILREENHYG